MDQWYYDSETAILRDQHQSSRLALNIWPRRVVAQAIISQTSFVPPITDIAVSGATAGWTSAKVGQMVVIRTTDGEELMTGVVRKALISGWMYIDPKVSGDAGRNAVTQQYLQTGAIVTIYDYMPLWTLFSAIRNGVFYKSYDRAYTNEGSQPAPQCNLGGWRQAWVDPVTNKARLRFVASAYYPIYFGALTYQFGALPAGVTLASGALNSSQVYLDFDPGFYIISCTATDVNGKSHTAYRPVWINTVGGSFDALSESVAVEVTSDRHEMRGRDMGFRLHGDLSAHDVPNGAGFLFSEARYYGESMTEIPANADGTQMYVVRDFAGFASSVREAYVDNHPLLELELKGTGSMLQEIACAPQAFIEKASPANWAEILQGHGTAQNFAWYILHYHCPNALALFDYTAQDDTDGKRRRSQQSTSAPTVGAMCDEIIAQLGGFFGSDSGGAIHAYRNPCSEEPTWRTNWVTSRLIVTEDDVVGEIGVVDNWRPQIGQLTCDGWSINYSTGETTALRSTWGKSAQAQGANKQSGPVFMVRDQSELNRKTGHQVAIENNAGREIRIKINPGMDVFDPLRDIYEWFVWLNIPAEYDPRGIGFEGEHYVKAVERNWRKSNGVYFKEVTWTLVPFTTGLPGETVPILTDNLQPDPDWSLNLSITYPEPTIYFDAPYPEGNYDPNGEVLFPTRIILVNLGHSIEYDGIHRPRVYKGMIDVVNRRVDWQEATVSFPNRDVNDPPNTMRITGYASDPYNPRRKFLMTTYGFFETRDIWERTPFWANRATYATVAHGRFSSGSIPHTIHSLRVSANRRGFMAARLGLSQYVTYSTNYGASWIESSIDGGSWDDEAYWGGDLAWIDTFELSQHNSGGAGWMYVLRSRTTGPNIPGATPPQTFAVSFDIFKSTNYGATWAHRSTVTLPNFTYSYGNDTRFMHLYIPHKRRNGTFNLNNSNKELYLIQPGFGVSYNPLYPYTSPSLMFSNNDAASFSDAYAPSGTHRTWGASERPMWTFPHDANIGYTVLTDKTSFFGNPQIKIARTTNAWANVTTYTHTLPDFSTDDGYGITNQGQYKIIGFGLNPNVICVWGDGAPGGAPIGRRFGISIDGGQTFFGEYPPDWPKGGGFGDFDAGDTIQFAEFDMTDFIPPT